MIARVIQDEFGADYHPGHARKLLRELGFSVQRPRRQLAGAGPVEQDRWQRYTDPSLKKTAERGGALLFADEASFRQDPTLYQTWPRVSHQPGVPTTGQRNTQKILGAVDLYRTQFYFGWGEVFVGQVYAGFLSGLLQCYPRQEVFLVQGNASYRWAPEVEEWLEQRGHRFVHLAHIPHPSFPPPPFPSQSPSQLASPCNCPNHFESDPLLGSRY
jgi:hypothetical protein